MDTDQGRGRSALCGFLQRLQPAVKFGPSDPKAAVRKSETDRTFLGTPVVESRSRNSWLSADVNDGEVAPPDGASGCHVVLLGVGCWQGCAKPVRTSRSACVTQA